MKHCRGLTWSTNGVYMTRWWAPRLPRTHNLDKSRIRATD